ncbi:MAG: histidine phosphatase family protein [bacterium]
MPKLMIVVLSVVLLLGCKPPKQAPPQQQPQPETNASKPVPAQAGVWPGKLPFKVLYLVRHGSTVMNRYSQIGGQIMYDPLDSLGFKERVGIYLLLRGEPIKAIFTSMQRRSQMTAKPLAAHFKLNIRATPALNEFAGGVSEGICYSLLGKNPRTEEAAACDQTLDDPLVKRAEAFLKAENKRRFKVGLDFRWAGGGESIPDVSKRLDAFLRTIPSELQDQTIAMVGHSGTNRFLLAKLMGWKPIDAIRVRQGHTTVYRVERQADGKPSLKIYLLGEWISCPEPPTSRKGLPCMRRAKPEQKPDGMGAPGMAPPSGKPGVKPPTGPGMKPGAMKPGARKASLGMKPFK